jgi:hypothetical protein
MNYVVKIAHYHSSLFINHLLRTAMPSRLILGLFLLASLSWGQTFDKPVRKQRVELGKAANPLSDRHRVTCYFFPNFMVKEVDMGEVGAERLGIVPVTPQSTGKCVRTRGKEEIVIPAEQWSGYFMGVKNGYVFFSGSDLWNSASPFAIFDSRTGKKLFDDSAAKDLSFITRPDQTITIRYLRVVSDDCFILKDAACWQRMAAKYGLDAATAPDCHKGYEASAESMAKGRCEGTKGPLTACIEKERPLALKQAFEAPSVISYPVEVDLSAKPSIKAAGAAAGCWPSD